MVREKYNVNEVIAMEKNILCNFYKEQKHIPITFWTSLLGLSNKHFLFLSIDLFTVDIEPGILKIFVWLSLSVGGGSSECVCTGIAKLTSRVKVIFIGVEWTALNGSMVSVFVLELFVWKLKTMLLF